MIVYCDWCLKTIFLSKYKKRGLKICIVGDQSRLQKGQLEVFVVSYTRTYIATQSTTSLHH